MIPVTLLEFHISTLYPLDLGANPGASIRGALYEALRIMYDTGAEVHSRNDAEDNPVAWLLRLEDDQTSGGHLVPRPIAVRPPLSAPACEMSFGLSFYGRGREHIPMVLSAVHSMQHIGVGRNRQHFTITKVEQVDPISQLVTPLSQAAGKLDSPPNNQQYIDKAHAMPSNQLTVHFLTPTRILQHKTLCKTPTFRPWFQRLLERTRQISELYTDDPVWIPFVELLAAADRIEMIQDNTHWVETKSGSSRDGKMRPTSGFVGEAQYQGDLGTLLPWIVLGQSLQVGKNTVKGCGWYRIVSPA